ncbi:MAG: histidine phosphatase family protein [Andreesenia angusta]|nr:histidine phosphatase family protein [Andreesenia angusta]
MRKIYLLRHGQSLGNENKIIQGQMNTELSKKGREQAYDIAKRFDIFKIDKIYTSNLSRAEETAQIIGSEINIDYEIVPEFIELSFGNWEGLDFDKVKSKYRDDFELWKKSPHKFNKDGFEGIETAKNRMIRGLDRITKEDGLENILIVSHGSAIKSMIIGLLEWDNSAYKNMVMANTGLSLIEKGDYNTILRFYNDYSHLRV